jgi:putative transcriptional regulator
MTKLINRHPDPATLMAYAAGTLNEALSAAVAAHVAMCPVCRREVRLLEAVGDALIASLAPTPAPSGRRHPARPVDVVLATPRTRRPVIDDGERLPRPIAQAYGLTFETVPWRILGPGVWHHRLQLSSPEEGDLRLLKIAAGRRMPEHGHGGTELTLVLDGAYSDQGGRYLPGDLQDVDEECEHVPMADKDLGCICLIASERPARFKGLIGRIVHPLTGL